MKTTIDQAMTKVFQQRDRANPEPQRSVHSSHIQSPLTAADSNADRTSRQSVHQAELYLDPPQVGLRPVRPDVLIPPAPAERVTECCATEPHCCDGMPRWSNAFVYQLSIQTPPAETVFPAGALAEPSTVEPQVIAAPTEVELSPETVCHAPPPLAETPAPRVELLPSPAEAKRGPAAPPDPPPGPPAATFRPVWEVDCLGLPPICRQIVETVAADLQRLCGHLSPASDGRRNLVSIDSCTRGEGRTTLALALAHGLAQTGQKILLVDADFRHPSLASQLGLAIRQGWEQAVRDGLPIPECCIHSIGDGFTVLPLGSAGLEANDLRTLQRIQDIWEELTGHFDRVLLDNGPGGHTWVALPPDRVQAHVVVRSLRQTSASERQRMLDRIRHPDDVMVSCVDNFATPSDLAMAKSA